MITGRSRREFLARMGAGLAAVGVATAGVPGMWTPRTCRAAALEEPRRPRRVEREVFIPSRGGRGVFPGFITYIHPKDPVLLHRFGWVEASDTYDDFHESVSRDGGRTWSEPVLKLRSRAVEGGRMHYCENAAFFDAERSRLITIVSKFLYPKGRFDPDVPRQLEIAVRDPAQDAEPEPATVDFGLAGGITISFCFPIKTSRGAIVVPATRAETGEDGKPLHHSRSRQVIRNVCMLIGTYGEGGALSWRLGKPLRIDLASSSRGLSESTPVELRDGRLALLARGSNAGMLEVPGRKWLSFSEDGGESWSVPEPLLDGDGRPIESSATGAAFFRSIRTGGLFFIGNIAPEGTRAEGNWPRSPLVIAEVGESPPRLRRETMAVIDERGPGDTARTQISNFRYYQERSTGDVIVFASRFGERSEREWRRADYYRYRVVC
jgi:hypothetical protein